MFTEKFFEGPGASTMSTYALEIALILLGAFLLGYWLRYLMNDRYKNRISTLEQELALLKNKTTDDANTKEEVDALLKKAREQKTEIDRLNTKLSDSYAGKIKAENQLAALQTKYDAISAPMPVVDEIISSAVEDNVITQDSNSVLDQSADSTAIDYASNSARDDLKKIEGIGPKIEQLLNADGIHTFSHVIDTTVDRIKGILTAAGPNYAVHDPTTWGEQAQLAKDGKWEALDELQEELKGGKRK